MKKVRLIVVVILFNALGCSDMPYKERGEAKFSQYAFTGMVGVLEPLLLQVI